MWTKYLGTIMFLNMSISNTMVFFIVLKKKCQCIWQSFRIISTYHDVLTQTTPVNVDSCVSKHLHVAFTEHLHILCNCRWASGSRRCLGSSRCRSLKWTHAQWRFCTSWWREVTWDAERLSCSSRTTSRKQKSTAAMVRLWDSHFGKSSLTNA